MTVIVSLGVLGRSGQLARALWRNPRLDAECFGRPEVDVADLESVRRALQMHAGAIVANAAAYTAVDRAEAEPEAADRVNRLGAGNAARVAAEAESPIVHFSTDYVFDGGKPGAYREQDAVAPLSVYGTTKEAGERAVREANPRHVIIRTAWLYSHEGDNFVASMLRLGRERAELRIVADQIGSPTYVEDLAAAAATVAHHLASGGRDRRYGTFHYCGGGVVSRFEFAEAIFAEATRHGYRPPVLKPVATAEYPTPARRPANSALDCTRIAEAYGIRQRPWRDSLAECVARMLAQGRGGRSS